MPFESRRRARDEKRDAVLRTAAQLFLEHGYHHATLNDVAQRLNITKPALYNYFHSKEDILFECWTVGREMVEDLITEIDSGDGNGVSKLRKLIQGYATVMASDFGACLVRFNASDLSEANQKIARAGKRRIDQAFRKYVRQGIADSSIMSCDIKLTTFAIVGSLNWIGHWFKDDGALPAEAIANEFSIRLTQGLATKQSTRQSTKKKASSTPARKRRSEGAAP